VLFADKSYSMDGGPFNTVKQGLLRLADFIFSDQADGKHSFNEVHTVWY